MGTRTTVVLAALALGACGGERPMTLSERRAVVAGVHTAVEARFAAMNEHDAEAVGAFYLEGEADAFLYAGVSDVIVGAEAVRTVTAPWYSLHEDDAFEWSILHTQALSPAVATVTIRGSTASAPHLLWTQVWVRSDDAWRLALEHESWPGAAEPSTHPMTSS